MRLSTIPIALVIAASALGLAGCSPAVQGANGIDGTNGSSGSDGAPGLDGAPATLGAQGDTGPTGARGLTGATGPRGLTGATGATGPSGGVPGTNGTNGIDGTDGADGAIGPAGAKGDKGDKGDTGDAGAAAVSDYAFIRSTAAQVIAIDADVAFNGNGAMTSAVTHAPGSTVVVLNQAGTYAVWFSVSGVEPSQFALTINGVAIDDSRYGSGAGTQLTTGMTIVTVAVGDVLTLRNSSSAAAVTLQTLAGGTETNINASLLIQKLG